MAYNVRTDIFEGPLELLLHLIKRNDLEISTIKIAEITSDYLIYLNLIRKLNVSSASEFLVMASTLIQIKARHFLPSIAEKEEDGNNTLNKLNNKILEYQKYKKIGELLSHRIIENSQIYYRPITIPSNQNFVLDVVVLDLAKSFYKTLKTFSSNIRDIVYQEIRVETKMSEILDVLKIKQYVFFSDILQKQKTNIASIVCFMAILELVKDRQIFVKQPGLFSEIKIYRICSENILQKV